jgi:hypothetical protein
MDIDPLGYPGPTSANHFEREQNESQKESDHCDQPALGL